MKTLAAAGPDWGTTAFVLGWFALLAAVLVAIIFAVGRVLQARSSARREESYRELLDRVAVTQQTMVEGLEEVKTQLGAINKAMSSFD